MQALILMIQFMTRYPIPVQVAFTTERFVEGMRWMPLIGLLVALPAAGMFLLADTWFSHELAAIAAVVVLILVTGGLHLDGIADAADGLLSYRSRERMLAIMRDATLGTNGVIAVVLSILIKYLLLANIPGRGALLAVLIAPILGRMALTWHAGTARYAREERGIGDFVNQTGMGQAALATLASVALVSLILLLSGLSAGLAVLAAAAVQMPAIALAVLFSRYCTRHLGGITGDTIGASIELTETFSCFVLLLVWKFLL